MLTLESAVNNLQRVATPYIATGGAHEVVYPMQDVALNALVAGRPEDVHLAYEDTDDDEARQEKPVENAKKDEDYASSQESTDPKKQEMEKQAGSIGSNVKSAKQNEESSSSSSSESSSESSSDSSSSNSKSTRKQKKADQVSSVEGKDKDKDEENFDEDEDYKDSEYENNETEASEKLDIDEDNKDSAIGDE